jgi:predicted phosphoribosyltransferase/dienelactone hydrolase
MDTPVEFRNSRGLRLSGILRQPSTRGKAAKTPVVLFAHGWGSSKRSQRNWSIADALIREGLAAFLFDFAGHGESEGNARSETLENQVDDLRCAVDWVEAREGLGPIGIAGSSSGGAVALEEAPSDPRVRALVLRAPSAAARFRQAARIEVPTLLVQGENDPLLERNRDLAQAFTCEHRLVSVPGAGHLFDEPGTFAAALHETVEWFRQWLANDRRAAGGQRAGHQLRIPAGAEQAHFRDRRHAGEELARRLGEYRGPDSLALGLPRGGVAVAEEVARELDCALDVLVSRKVRAPSQPELAIGAIAEGDVVVWNEEIIAALGLGEADRARELKRARRELEEHVATYRAVAARADIKQRTVLAIDDGVATGATLKAALAAIQREGAARIVVALPGGPRDTLEEVARLPGVHQVVAVAVPRDFYAVGQLYDSFESVSTDEVCSALRRDRERRRAAAGTEGRIEVRRGPARPT